MLVSGIGDIVAIIKLCDEVASFLGDALQAPGEYQEAVAKIGNLYEVFDLVSRSIAAFEDHDHASVPDFPLELFYKLKVETQRGCTALTEAAKILSARWVNSWEASPLPFRKGWRQVRWRRTHRLVEKRLSDALQSQSRITTLFGISSLPLAEDLRNLLAKGVLGENNRPLQMGLPGSGGLPKDHIEFQDGLGRTTYLLQDLCERSKGLHGFLEYMYRQKPGEEWIGGGRYRLYCTSFHTPQELTEDNWNTLVRPGSSICISFVVGTSIMRCVNFCLICNREQRGDWDTWRNCTCGVAYYVTETDKFGYEPREELFDGPVKSLEDWKLTHQSRDSDLRECKTTASDQPGPLHQRDEASPSQAHYFRNMIIVFSPAFNFVFRNVFCRCILGQSSLSRFVPPMTFLTLIPCPTHGPADSCSTFREVTKIRYNYISDPYFDEFGGYELFVQTVRALSSYSVIRGFVDIDKDTEQNEETITTCSTAEQVQAVHKYKVDVIRKVETLLPCYELRGHSSPPQIQNWVSAEKNDLIEALIEEDVKDSWEETLSSWPDYAFVLCAGRVYFESREIIKNDDRLLVIF